MHFRDAGHPREISERFGREDERKAVQDGLIPHAHLRARYPRGQGLDDRFLLLFEEGPILRHLFPPRRAEVEAGLRSRGRGEAGETPFVAGDRFVGELYQDDDPAVGRPRGGGRDFGGVGLAGEERGREEKKGGGCAEKTQCWHADIS
ncbi:MAG: hypothetical protein ABI610_07730 [Acidobacteriota bacterium]